MEATWSSLVSYGMSLDALQDFLPLDRTLDVKTVRYDTLKVAKRMEAELGEERSGFIEGDLLAIGNGCRRLRVSSPWALMGAMSAIGWTSSITSQSLSARVS